MPNFRKNVNFAACLCIASTTTVIEMSSLSSPPGQAHGMFLINRIFGKGGDEVHENDLENNNNQNDLENQVEENNEIILAPTRDYNSMNNGWNDLNEPMVQVQERTREMAKSKWKLNRQRQVEKKNWEEKNRKKATILHIQNLQNQIDSMNLSRFEEEKNHEDLQNLWNQRPEEKKKEDDQKKKDDQKIANIVIKNNNHHCVALTIVESEIKKKEAQLKKIKAAFLNLRPGMWNKLQSELPAIKSKMRRVLENPNKLYTCQQVLLSISRKKLLNMLLIGASAYFGAAYFQLGLHLGLSPKMVALASSTLELVSPETRKYLLGTLQALLRGKDLTQKITDQELEEGGEMKPSQYAQMADEIGLFQPLNNLKTSVALYEKLRKRKIKDMKQALKDESEALNDNDDPLENA